MKTIVALYIKQTIYNHTIPSFKRNTYRLERNKYDLFYE